MKKSFIVVLALLQFPLSPASAAMISAGQKCTKVNQSTIVKSQKLICAKAGNKLLWKAAPVIAAPTPAPNSSTTPIQVASGPTTSVSWKTMSAAEVKSAAKSAMDKYFETKRTPSQVVTVLAQEGVDSTLKAWVLQGATLVAQTFTYPSSTRAFYDVIAIDRDWLQDAYTKAGYSADEVRDRLGGFDSGSPAFGGTVSNTWNAKTIKNDNLMVRDKIGMAQTSGHEFFHTIQERLAGRNPGRDGNEIPNWFWEGPACFVGINAAATVGALNFDSEGRQAMVDRFKNGNPQTKSLPLKDIKANDGIIDPYGIGFAGTEYLVAQVGVEKFLAIYAELGKNKSIDKAFFDSTGITLEDFYQHFESDRAALGFAKN